MKKNQMEFLETKTKMITEVQKSMDRRNNKMDQREKIISELKDRTIEMTPTEQQTGQTGKRNKQNNVQTLKANGD